MLNPRQVRLRSLLLLVVGVACLLALIRLALAQRGVEARQVLATSAVLLGAVLFRLPCAWLARRLGRVARHALAWFAATLGGAGVFLLLNAMDRSTTFALDMADGLLFVAMLFGLLMATLVEPVMIVLEFMMEAT